MKLIIDIDEEDYKIMKHNVAVNNPLCPIGQKEMVTKIANGTPLPKGHGRLIDISKIDEDRVESDNPIIYLSIDGVYIEAISLRYLDNLPTIIEAESEEIK